MNKSIRGFTIVELLIVIVVIAILAAISIVAYNGIQARAKNSQMSSSISQYVKILNAYIADKGTFPIVSQAPSSSIACLDAELSTSAQCHGNQNNSLTQTLKTELLKETTSLPKYPNQYTLLNNASTPNATGGTFTGWYLFFRISGSNDCPSVGGLTFLNSDLTGSDRNCRYSINATTNL